MLKILKSPYPCVYGQKVNFITSLCIGIFVALFLVVFEPFNISESKDNFRVLKSAGFGLVSFIVLLVFYFIVPKIFKDFFKEKNYTLGKDIIASAGLIFLVGIANAVYSQCVLNQNANSSIWIMIWQTFLVGIFPLSFLSLLQYNRQLKANLKVSKDIQLSKPQSQTEEGLNSEPQYFSISGDQENDKIELNDLLYLESDGNYVNLNYLNNGIVSKSLQRVTLKSIESENAFTNILRCHRSYIVNLDQIEDVRGNAQGLKLSLKNCEDSVPVSKKYIPAFKRYFRRG